MGDSNSKRLPVGDGHGLAVELSTGKQDTRCPASLPFASPDWLWIPIFGDTLHGVTPPKCTFVDHVADLGWQSEEWEGVAGDGSCGSSGDIRSIETSTFRWHVGPTLVKLVLGDDWSEAWLVFLRSSFRVGSLHFTSVFEVKLRRSLAGVVCSAVLTRVAL